MKVAVSATGKSLDSGVDPRFGRASYFLIVDTENMSTEAFDNTNITSAHGAGIGAAQLIASKGAKAVITGHVGPNAYQSLNAAGVKIYTIQAGSVKEAVDGLTAGSLNQVNGPTSAGHSGGGGGGRSRGRGF